MAPFLAFDYKILITRQNVHHHVLGQSSELVNLKDGWATVMFMSVSQKSQTKCICSQIAKYPDVGFIMI